jgi:hypothetical protein
MAGTRSAAVTAPLGPTASASGMLAAPRPQPMSRARSPGTGSSSSTSRRAIGPKNSTPEES